MASTVNPPRGMRDFLPAEKAKRERALGVIRRVYAAHGFDEIETPVVEDYDRLHAGIGGDNEKLAFNVLKRGLDAETLQRAATSGDVAPLTDLGLRYDLTVPLARFYATHRAELPPVFRSIQIAPVWRAERPQKGRYRQFIQCDIDIIGETGRLAEIELISATTAVLSELGVSGTRIRINDRRLLVGMLDACGFAESEHASVLITIDKLDKIGADGVIAELRDRGASGNAVDAMGDYLTRASSEPATDCTQATIEALLPPLADPSIARELASIASAVVEGDGAAQSDADPGAVIFDPFLVRGMGYYTGPIFEIEHPQLGYSLGGGGRYDGMIGRFLGSDVPAAGFSIGFERIVDLVVADEDATEQSIVLVYDPTVAPEVLSGLKTQLVASGRRVRLEPRVKNMRALLERVTLAGFNSFATVGAEQSSADQLQIKSLD